MLGIANSRMKDFYVIWILAREFDFDGQLLSRAIQRAYSWRLTRSTVSSSISAFWKAPTHDPESAAPIHRALYRPFRLSGPDFR